MTKYTDILYEDIMKYIFIFSVILTIFAPAVHYIGFALCFVFLIYGQIRYGKAVFSSNRFAKRHIIEIFLFAFFVWSAFPNFVAAASFHSWGRGASVYLEMLLWYLLTVKLLDSEAWRQKYITLFVIVTTIIFCMILCASTLGWFSIFPNLTMNINSLGLYATLALPYIFYYALWHWETQTVLKYIVCIICLMTAFISFSSGAWLAIFCMMPFIFYFSLKKGKLVLKNIVLGLCLFAIAFMAVNYWAGGAILKRFYGEIAQVTAMKDMDTLTNRRYSIWRGTIKMIYERPVIGYGRDSFEAEHANLLARDKELAEATGVYDHAHNTYLELAFAGGIPSALLFCIIYGILLKKCWSNRNIVENKIPWHIIHLTLLIGMIVYGLTGDVFEARRDLAVIFWTALGIIRVMPEKTE